MRIITTKLFVVFAFTSFVTFAQNNTTHEGTNSGEQGDNNSFFGANSGRNTTANNNSFFGANSGQSNTTGKTNVFVGRNSGRNNTEGNYNVFAGNLSGFNNVSGNFNTFLGTFAGRENINGRRNVFIGGNAGRNSLGNENIFIGHESGNNTTSSNNTFIGTYSGKNNTTGNGNVFNGYNTGFNNTTGRFNSFFGSTSGNSNITGSSNTFLGNETGQSTTIGSNNVFIGSQAGGDNDTGSFNVYIGTTAGIENEFGSGNVFIGNNAGGTVQGDNKLYIDNSATLTPLIYGDFATDQLGINTNTIPDGYNFAVGGGASIDGSIKAGTLDIEAPDNSEDWLPVTIGREVKPFFRNFNFVVSPSTNTNELLGFTIIDKNLISRQDNYFRDDFTRISYMSNRNQYIFSLDHNDREGQDQAAIQMPLVNSKIVIAGFGDYLEDQGHKLIVKDGTALIENAIYTNGRIAIGTTEEDPGYALTVKGKVHVQEVKVDLLGVLAPDYVFYEDYKLKTLEQVEDYIDQEGHLPNIPSALEMEKEGVNLKEMNMKLLEKVEELTLYTIAQEKAIKEQQEAIKEQQEANNTLEKRLQKLEELLKH